MRYLVENKRGKLLYEFETFWTDKVRAYNYNNGQSEPEPQVINREKMTKILKKAKKGGLRIYDDSGIIL